MSREAEDFDVLHYSSKKKFVREYLIYYQYYHYHLCGWRMIPFFKKEPRVYSVMTRCVCCTCLPQCMKMLLDTFFKFLSYSFCNCCTEGLSSRQWHSLLERWFGCYISCFLRISYVHLQNLVSSHPPQMFCSFGCPLVLHCVCSLVLHLAGAGGYSFHCYSHFGWS